MATGAAQPLAHAFNLTSGVPIYETTPKTTKRCIVEEVAKGTKRETGETERGDIISLEMHCCRMPGG